MLLVALPPHSVGLALATTPTRLTNRICEPGSRHESGHDNPRTNPCQDGARILPLNDTELPRRWDSNPSLARFRVKVITGPRAVNHYP